MTYSSDETLKAKVYNGCIDIMKNFKKPDPVEQSFLKQAFGRSP
jgi:hypothetical protein